VKLELSSFREIIRALQEEIREISPSTQLTENKGNEVYEDKEPYIFHQRVKDGLRSHKTDKKLQCTRRNLRQLSLDSSNRFATSTKEVSFLDVSLL
jgi:hypothetical protein